MANEFRLLPPDAINELQTLNESNFPHLVVRATIATKSGVRVGGALVDQTSNDPALVLENVPCRLTQQGASSTSSADQRRSNLNYVLTIARGTVLPPDTFVTVRGQDRASDAQWTRVVRVVDSLSQSRAVASVGRFLCVDAGPTNPRQN